MVLHHQRIYQIPIQYVFVYTEIALENKFGEEAMPNAEVIADRPFLFFIQDEATRQLLFTGRVSDPAVIDGAFKLP